MSAVQTVFGVTVMIAFVACVSVAQPSQRTPISSPPNACAAPLKHAPMLCDRVTLDGSAECAMCAEARGCLSSTHVYCATSCDDPACRTR